MSHTRKNLFNSEAKVPYSREVTQVYYFIQTETAEKKEITPGRVEQFKKMLETLVGSGEAISTTKLKLSIDFISGLKAKLKSSDQTDSEKKLSELHDCAIHHAMQNFLIGMLMHFCPHTQQLAEEESPKKISENLYMKFFSDAISWLHIKEKVDNVLNKNNIPNDKTYATCKSMIEKSAYPVLKNGVKSWNFSTPFPFPYGDEGGKFTELCFPKKSQNPPPEKSTSCNLTPKWFSACGFAASLYVSGAAGFFCIAAGYGLDVYSSSKPSSTPSLKK